MLKIRVVPVLSFNGFALVKTKQFSAPRMVGNPVQAARVYDSRGVDEIIFVDIFASSQKRSPNPAIVRDILNQCFMPLAVGGGISTLDDIAMLFKIGADKIILKNAALTDIKLVTDAARTYGAQAVCIAVDALKVGPAQYVIKNQLNINLTLEQFISRVVSAGAGELFINSVANDGMMNGFDHELFALVRSLTSLPLIACGGGGEPKHFVDLYSYTQPEAVAAASIFHFTQYTPLDIKRALHESGVAVRMPAN